MFTDKTLFIIIYIMCMLILLGAFLVSLSMLVGWFVNKYKNNKKDNSDNKKRGK